MTSPYSIWPLRFSPDPAAMITFFAALGLHQAASRGSGSSAGFLGRSGGIGVHEAETSGPETSSVRTALNLVTADVAAAADELRGDGVDVQTRDGSSGVQGTITSPSGLVIGLREPRREGPAGSDQFADQSVAASMAVVAICTVSDVQREAAFLAHFGFAAIEPGEGYLPLTSDATAGVIGLRAGGVAPITAGGQTGPPYRVDLGAETSEPFDALAGRLQAGGYAATTVEDESGMWVRVIDPDGESLEIRPTR